MKTRRIWIHGTCLLCMLLISIPQANASEPIRLRTVLGDIFVTPTPDAAPQTVANFLDYLSSGNFEDTFFHQSLPGGEGTPQLIAAGKFKFPLDSTSGITPVTVLEPIPNEFNQSNRRGTIAMVVPSGQPDGATNAWFINVADNGGSAPNGLDFLDGGATVFGTINPAGMEIVDAISAQCTDDRGGDLIELPTLIDQVEGSREELILITQTQQFTSISPPVSAVLPGSRSIGTDGLASAFATILNTSGEVAASCRIKPNTDVPAVFEYFQTDPQTNQTIGPANPEFDIAANGFATLVFSFRPINPFASTTVEFDYSCGNATAAATPILGVNTFQLAALGLPGADIIAIAATAGNNGINDIPAGIDSGAFVVATANVGLTETLSVSADTGEASVPLALFVCETNSVTGACLSPPANSVESAQAANSTATFAVFTQLTQSGSEIPFDPAVNRAFVRFQNLSGELRGSTSVALRTVPAS